MFDRAKLRKAIIARDKDIVARVLTRHPKLINQPLGDFSGIPLALAARRGDIDMAELLMTFGAEANFDILSDAAYRRQWKLVKAWVADQPEFLQKRNAWGESLLHIAAKCDDVDVLTWLLDQGLDVEALDGRGRTPLKSAEEASSEAALALLRPYQERAYAAHKKKAQQLVIRQEGDETWTKLDDSRIAHIRHEQAIGYRVTAIFNFATGERTRIYRNVETDQESVETTSFDQHTSGADVREAQKRLVKAGGKSFSVPAGIGIKG